MYTARIEPYAVRLEDDTGLAVCHVEMAEPDLRGAMVIIGGYVVDDLT